MTIHRGLLACLFLACRLTAASPSPLPESFTLGKYIPSDWWMYWHFVHNPERQWIDQEWSEVFAELKKTNLDKDLLSLIMNQLSDQDRSTAEVQIAKARELLGAVRWSDLIAREMVVAERIRPPVPDYLVMFHGAPGSGEHNVQKLKAIIEHVFTFIPTAKLTEEKQGGVDVLTMEFAGTPYTFHLLRSGDIVGIVTNAGTLSEVVSLLEGRATVQAVVDSPRFREALSTVKRPEDMVLYFDIKMLFTGINGLINAAFAGEVNAVAEPAHRRMVRAAMNLVDFVDFIVVSKETESRQEFTYSAVRLQAEKADSPIPRIVRDRKPFEKFDQFIPADATGFWASTMFDLELTYKTVIQFVERNVPEGRAAIEKWNVGLASVGFDPQRDVFDWFSGEIMVINVPSATPSPMGGGGDVVCMIRVKDSKLALQKTTAGLNWAKEMIGREAGPAQAAQVNIGPSTIEDFLEITIGPLAMFMRPVIGVKGDWLILATNPAAVTKCLDVANGKAPSIITNERFKKEGLTPKGPVVGLSFQDTSKTAQELAAALGMASFFGGMGIAQMPVENPGDKQTKEVVQKLFSMAMKFSPVVAKMDFYSSTSSLTTQDGANTLTTSVVTYKPAGAVEKSAKNEP